VQKQLAVEHEIQACLGNNTKHERKQHDSLLCNRVSKLGKPRMRGKAQRDGRPAVELIETQVY